MAQAKKLSAEEAGDILARFSRTCDDGIVFTIESFFGHTLIKRPSLLAVKDETFEVTFDKKGLPSGVVIHGANGRRVPLSLPNKDERELFMGWLKETRSCLSKDLNKPGDFTLRNPHARFERDAVFDGLTLDQIGIVIETLSARPQGLIIPVERKQHGPQTRALTTNVSLVRAYPTHVRFVPSTGYLGFCVAGTSRIAINEMNSNRFVDFAEAAFGRIVAGEKCADQPTAVFKQ